MTDRTTRTTTPTGGTAVLDEPGTDFRTEDEHWRENFMTRPYVDTTEDYDTYRPAYQYGWEARQRYPEREWDDRLEAELSQGWAETQHGTRQGWEKVKGAVRDAWHRVERRLPGDADRDGR